MLILIIQEVVKAQRGQFLKITDLQIRELRFGLVFAFSQANPRTEIFGGYIPYFCIEFNPCRHNGFLNGPINFFYWDKFSDLFQS